MGDLASQIHWGTGFENVLDFDFPQLIDNCRFWRQPAPGAVRSRNAAGTTDAAIYGYDYVMSGRARWFDASSYSGPLGLQAFFDWAGRGNTFRFVPDKNVTDFYVDGVTLEQPFESPEPGLEEADGSQSIDMVLRNPTVDFGQAMRGIMFEYVPGASLTDPVAAAFTRNDIGTRIGKDGLTYEDVAHVLRDRHYAGGLRSSLFEGGRTNLIENGDAESDAVGIVLQNGATIARNQTNFRHGSWGVQVTTANLANSGVRWSKRDGANIAATAATTYVLQSWVYAPSASVGKTLQLRLRWKDVANAEISNSISSAVTLVAGWQRMTFSATAPANTTQVELLCETNAIEGIFDFWVDLADFSVGAYAREPIPTNTAAVTQDADVLTWPWPWSVQDIFVYASVARPPHADLTGTVAGSRGIYRIGAGTVATNLGSVRGPFAGSATRTLEAYIDTVTTDANRSTVVPGGSPIEYCASYRNLKTGGMANLDVGSGPAGEVGPATAFSEWTSQLLEVGAFATSFLDGGLIRLKIGPRVFGGVTRDTVVKARAA